MNDSQNNIAYIKDNRKRDNHILPEGNVDELLMEILIPPKNKYNQQGGAPAVATKMTKHLNDNFAIGILDRDKRRIDYKKEFDIVMEKYDVILYKHKNPSKHHYFICHPTFEKWIISETNNIGKTLDFYDLPDNFKELKDITEHESCKKDERLKKLFRALKKEKAQGINLLFQWTDYLISYSYNANINELKNLS